MTDERGGRYFREARFFLAGDKVAAQSHILEARSLMGHMRDMHALGGPPIQVRYATLQDGTTIRATMMNGQYQAQIFTPSHAVEPQKKTGIGEIICLPYDDTDAPDGWGYPFTFDAEGTATAGTPGGAHPYVIFSAEKVVRQPNIPTAFPLLPGLDTTDPLYYPHYWVNAEYTDVFSWSSTGLYHRGKLIADVGPELLTIINAGGYSFALDDVYAGAVINAAASHIGTNKILISASWALLLPDMVTYVYGTAVLYYTLGGTPGAETMTYQATVWQTGTGAAALGEAVFNQSGDSLNIAYTELPPAATDYTADVVDFAWDADLAAFVATPVNYFLSARGSTSYPRPLTPCWRDGEAAMIWALRDSDPEDIGLVRTYFDSIITKKLVSGAETSIVSPGGADVLVHWDLWQHRHVIADVNYIDYMTGDFSLFYVAEDGAAYPIGSGYSLTYYGPMFQGVDRICAGLLAGVVDVVFSKNTMLCAIQGAGLRYFNGEHMTDGSSMLGVARTDNPLYSTCPGSLDSHSAEYKLGLI